MLTILHHLRAVCTGGGRFMGFQKKGKGNPQVQQLTMLMPTKHDHYQLTNITLMVLHTHTHTHTHTINVQHIKANIWYHGSSSGAHSILVREGIPNPKIHYHIRAEYTATACCSCCSQTTQTHQGCR